MSAEHTPEPWFPRHPMGGLEVYPDGETRIALATFLHEDDCARAIECVNACAGIKDPSAVPDLLGAALEIIDRIENGDGVVCYRKLQAAIAKAEKGAA